MGTCRLLQCPAAAHPAAPGRWFSHTVLGRCHAATHHDMVCRQHATAHVQNCTPAVTWTAAPQARDRDRDRVGASMPHGNSDSAEEQNPKLGIHRAEELGGEGLRQNCNAV